MLLLLPLRQGLMLEGKSCQKERDISSFVIVVMNCTRVDGR